MTTSLIKLIEQRIRSQWNMMDKAALVVIQRTCFAVVITSVTLCNKGSDTMLR